MSMGTIWNRSWKDPEKHYITKNCMLMGFVLLNLFIATFSSDIAEEKQSV